MNAVRGVIVVILNMSVAGYEGKGVIPHILVKRGNNSIY
jgi:hypothetical protein